VARRIPLRALIDTHGGLREVAAIAAHPPPCHVGVRPLASVDGRVIPSTRLAAAVRAGQAQPRSCERRRHQLFSGW
jgi:hypothetical protein